MYFESHAHYTDERFDPDRDELLRSLHESGIGAIVNVGDSVRSSRLSVSLAERYDYIYAAVGVHPHNAEAMTSDDISELRRLAAHEKAVAIGEIGLDFYYDSSPRAVQEARFIDQLALAAETGLPVIIHSRDANRLTIDIIKESGVRRGVIHCFDGDARLASEYVELGFLIGIGGIVTYKNAPKLVEVTSFLPISSILIETDSPYLSPVPVRGTRNTSKNLAFIAQKISEIKQIPLEKVAKITYENALSFFGIK
jgi:TatD DNase family protein